MSAPTLERPATVGPSPRARLAEAHRCAAGLAAAHHDREPAPAALHALAALIQDAANTTAPGSPAAAQYARFARTLAFGLMDAGIDRDVAATILDKTTDLLLKALDRTEPAP